MICEALHGNVEESSFVLILSCELTLSSDFNSLIFVRVKPIWCLHTNRRLLYYNQKSKIMCWS